MLALPLLLFSAFFSVTTADKADVLQWTEIVRKAADRFVKNQSWQRYGNLDNDLKPVQAKIQADGAELWWVHKYPGRQWPSYCGGAGRKMEWLIGFLCQSHPEIKGFNPGRANADELAAWNVVTDQGTKKLSIKAEFNGAKLKKYTVFFDKESPRV